MKSKTQKPILAICAGLLSLFLGTSVLADSHAPPPPGVVEGFSCSYLDGKDIDDLMAARDYYLKQAAKEGLTPPPAYLWNLYKGTAPIDFVWFTAHENMAAFAAEADRTPSAEMIKVQERFDTVATCQTGLANISNVFTHEGASDDDGQALVTSSACMARGPATADNMQDLWGHINDTFSGMGDNAPMATYALMPITGDSDTADVYVFNVNANVTAWTDFMAALSGSGEGQSLIRHFNAMMDCNFSMYMTQQVIGGEG